MDRLRFFPLSLLVALGIVMAAYLSMTWLVLCTGVAAVVLALRPLGRQRNMWLGLAAVAVTCGYFYVYEWGHRTTLAPLVQQHGNIVLAGTIDTPVKRDGDTAQLMLLADQYEHNERVYSIRPKERIALRVKLDDPLQIAEVESWRSGDRLRGNVSLALPEGARNPHAFDYARYLRWQAVYVIAETTLDKLSRTPSQYHLLAWFESLQAAAAKRVQSLFNDQEIAGLMNALLLGKRTEASPELTEIYADLGIIHVLAISGLHVSLVTGCFLFLLQRLGLSREKSIIIAGSFLASYVLLVGASPSAVRAGLMGGTGLLLLYMRKRLDIKEIWGMALIIMLIANPYHLWHTGFQLSFAVTLGLIIYVPILMQSPWPRNNWLKSSLAVALAAAIVSFPFLIYWFHQFSPLSVLVNLVVVPIITLIALPGGYILLALFHLYPALSITLADILSSFLNGLHMLLAWLKSLHVPFRHWPHPDPLWLLAYGLWLGVIPLCWQQGYQRKRDCLIYVISLLLLCWLARQPFSGLNEVRITFLDVGQGDCIVVEIARNTVYLIDGGGTIPYFQEEWKQKQNPFEVGKDIVVPYLRSRGIERINRLVITHGDYDHIGGLAAVLARFPIDAVLVNGLPPQGEEEKRLINSALQKGMMIYTGQPGMSWRDHPHVWWTWLHPQQEREATKNDASVVLLLQAFGKTILFTGDLEEAGERQLLERNLLQTIHVLKVGHHGSKTSTSSLFLQQTQPEAAVISVGRHNRYAHPSPVVLDRLREAGVAILRTDLHGAITLTIRPDDMYWQFQKAPITN